MEHVLSDHAPLRLRRPARLLRLASDERLVVLVRQGDEGAFEALYDRHHPAILGFCRHMLGTPEEAEDVVQHTFLAAFRDLARHDKAIELRPWLFTIARNRCLSLLRARRAHVAIELAEPATDGLAATVERREDLRELLGDLARLPEEQRAALLLAELGALDHAGIASVLGCPREKVKALVFQARTSLAASREARATPCEEIRVELATASGAALRRGALRRHLRACPGCRAFKAEVATQRKLLAVALPVVPTVALKASVLSGGGATSSGGAVAAAGTAATGGSGSVLGGAFGTLATTGAGKVALSLVVAGAVAGGGALTEQLQHSEGAPAGGGAPAQSDGAWRPPLQSGGGSPLLRPSAGPHSAPARDARPTPSPLAAGQAHRESMHAPPAHGAVPGPQSGGGVPPGHTKTSPGQGATPPGQAKTPPGQTTAPGNSLTPPGQTKTPPGQGGTPPGQMKTPPGQGGTPPGQMKTPPGQGGTPPGQTTTPPGHGGVLPGQARAPAGAGTGGGSATMGSQGSPYATPPGQAGGVPSGLGAVPGQAGGAPGNSGDAPGHAGGAPGNSGNAPGHAG